MTSLGSFENSDFENMASNFNNFVNGVATKQMVMNSLNEAVALVMSGVKERTPVDTGALRRNWSSSGVRYSGSFASVDISNNLHYAPYLEYGHRLRNGGYYPGVFMLTNTLNDVDKVFEKILEKNFNKFMKGTGLE
ncbi:HK97 gp10 family phage protein [Fructilactobacillus vespulae]|uniref:HK97 gp10 family phage protein n=1 Tax=Fructilactobacillus vespulae TaxID=1249630 RepID=UPI0039B3E3D9